MATNMELEDYSCIHSGSSMARQSIEKLEEERDRYRHRAYLLSCYISELRFKECFDILPRLKSWDSGVKQR